MFITVFDDVVFIEGDYPETQKIKKIKVSIKGMFKQAQLKTLDDVKKIMAREVRSLGANAVINFTYGQSSRFWDQFFNLDDIKWYGNGTAAKLSDTAFQQLISQCKIASG